MNDAIPQIQDPRNLNWHVMFKNGEFNNARGSGSLVLKFTKINEKPIESSLPSIGCQIANFGIQVGVLFFPYHSFSIVT